MLSVQILSILLAISSESYVHRITILTGLPAVSFVVLLTLSLFHMELDIYGFVGFFMLIGIVKKNAIMMIDFALDSERSGWKSTQEAIYHGALVRFRPIMMTTLAAIFGTLPIALGTGMGSESRRPLGIAVVGGLAFSQIVTLYVTPVIYTYLDAFQAWLGARGARRAPTGIPAPALGAQVGD